MSNTRRDFITAAVGMGAGALLASCGTKNVGTLLGPDAAHAGALAHPWPYEALDAKEAAQRAYEIYWERHCMTGPFQAIVAELGESLGEPYSAFPFEMFEAGSGGIQVSTVCGTVNGAAMAIGLFVGSGADRGALISDLFNWYEQTALPDFIPTSPVNDIQITQSIASSNLCHVSISKWCDASGLSAFSPEKKERCARLTGSITEKLVTMLNSYFAGTFTASTPLTDTTKSCRGCHDKGGMLENTRAKMDCLSCHADHTAI